MDSSRLDALANDFFAAISARDLERVAELYDPEVEVWHNVTQQTQTREENTVHPQREPPVVGSLHVDQ